MPAARARFALASAASLFLASAAFAQETLTGPIDPGPRARGEGPTGLGKRFDNPIGDADAIGQRFEAFVDSALATRGFVTTPLEPGSAELSPDVTSRLFWWEAKMASVPTRDAAVSALPLSDLMQKATATSLQIQVFAELPAIRDTSIAEARGRFTPEFYAEGRTTRREDATTALYQTGGDPRLKENEDSVEFGLRSRVQTGAQVSLSQRFSDLESNIITYQPELQSRSRTIYSVVQPLLRDSGIEYNKSFEALARLETQAAELEFRRQVESHLLEVTRTYWTLFLARANLVQQERAADAVSTLAGRIDERRNIDGMALQLNRAKAIEAERKAGLVRARNAVRNAEARLRALVNDPQLNAAGAAEIAPADQPATAAQPIDLQSDVARAVKSRPEVRSAMVGYRASLLREGMAANESLPQLDLVLEGSLSGGRDGVAWGPAFSNAWYGMPGYVAGVRLAVPLGNDERKARHDRRKLETWQQAMQTRTTIETVILEMEVTANEYVAAWNDLARRGEALRLATADNELLGTRYESGLSIAGTGGSDNGILYLDQLLASQDRVADAELQVAQAQATLEVAHAARSRAMGTLLEEHGLTIVRDEAESGADKGLPRYRIAKAGGSAK